MNSQAALKRAYWGLPQDGLGADVTGKVTCPNGFPCDAFANAANYGDPQPDMNKRLTVIWTCQPQRFVLSEVVITGLKVRMDCIAGPPIVPRTISILEATWGSGSSGSTVDVTQQVRDICGEDSTRCQVPAMAYIFGMPGSQSQDAAHPLHLQRPDHARPAVAGERRRRPALRAQRRPRLLSPTYCGSAGAPGGGGARRQSPVMMPPRPPVVDDTASAPSFLL